MTTDIQNSITQTADSQAALSPNDAVSLLKNGNARFLEKKGIERDFHVQVEETTTGQYPFAAVLSCIDSRVSS